jgi:hypothetical protein
LSAEGFVLKPSLLFFVVLIVLHPQALMAWGPYGHRIISSVATPLLSDSSRAFIAEILGDQSLGSAAIWADQMRGNPSVFWQEKAGAYHYVTVPEGRRYEEVGAPEKGDGITALARFRQVIADPQATLQARQLALKFSIHIIQDLHQPLHVGNGIDRGGTRYWVRFEGKKNNLHRIWDTDLLLFSGRSESEWVAFLSSLPVNEAESMAISPLQWVAESQQLRDTLYPATDVIDKPYLQQHQGQLALRLQLAALRTAAYLNELFR